MKVNFIDKDNANFFSHSETIESKNFSWSKIKRKYFTEFTMHVFHIKIIEIRPIRFFKNLTKS